MLDGPILESLDKSKVYSIKKLVDMSKSYKERISEDLWKKVGEMEIRKPFGSKRKRTKLTSVVPKANSPQCPTLDRSHSRSPQPSILNIIVANVQPLGRTLCGR